MGDEAMDAPRRQPARRRLLDAADRLFYTHGINATGVDAVVEAAQVAKMTFYKHFGGKDGLIVAYLESRDARWRSSLEEAIDAAGDDPEARLLAIFDALRLWVEDPRFRGCSFANAAAELATEGHPAREIVTAHKRALHGRMVELARAAGHQNPESLADRLLLLFEGATTAHALDTVPDAVDRARATALYLAHSS